MKEKIVKLINSGSKEDIILGMHLLGQYTWEEIVEIIDENFKEGSRFDRKLQRMRYVYRDCSVATSFQYGDKIIYVGATNIIIDHYFKNSPIILVK